MKSSYTHFTLSERESLRVLRESGLSMRQIAVKLNRNVSTISRELKRNGKQDSSYNAWWACSLYIHRRKRCRRKPRIASDPELFQYVLESLNKYWSPEIITAKWKLMHPDAKLSHSTIYRAVLQGQLPEISRKTHLRRRNLRKYKKGNRAAIHPEFVIAQRPELADARQRIGDWEGDTLRGGHGQGCLVTCVDRKSRYLTAAISKDMSSEKVGTSLVSALKELPVLTLTLDRGSEFALFRSFQEELAATVYFADPHAPWQRGSIENINGLLRFFFPKGCDFRTVDQDTLKHVLFLINSRPRKCLGWLSPIDFLAKCCT